MAIKGRNNFFDEVRRIKSKMYPPETMGAGVARFEFDTDGLLDIFLVTTRARLSHGDEFYYRKSPV